MNNFDIAAGVSGNILSIEMPFLSFLKEVLTPRYPPVFL